MPGGSDEKPYSKIRTFLKFSWIVVGVGVIYVALVFYSRRQQNRELEQRAADQRRAEEKRTVEMLGGNRFDIISFYASPGVIRRGDSVELCYGVSNAKSVRLEPQTEAVWPSLSRCFTTSLDKSTTYTLTAKDSAGHSKTATLTVQVR
jgi:hypothetical protein